MDANLDEAEAKLAGIAVEGEDIEAPGAAGEAPDRGTNHQEQTTSMAAAKGHPFPDQPEVKMNPHQPFHTPSC